MVKQELLEVGPNIAVVIGSAPFFEEVLAEYEVAGFEAAVNRLKSDLLNCAIHTRNLAAAIKQQLKNVEMSKSDPPESRHVPVGLVLAVMHWNIERAADHSGESPKSNVTGDEVAGFVLELGGWRARYDAVSDALSDAALFGTAVDQASGLDEIEPVRESRARYEGALAEVIMTLKSKDRKKI